MAELTSFRFSHQEACEKCGKPLLDKEKFCTGHEHEWCERCKNHGYYKVGISGKVEQLTMFCACEVGQILKKITQEWRVDDIRRLTDDILPRLRVIKNSLHDPSKAGKFLDVLLNDMTELLSRPEKALKELK